MLASSYTSLAGRRAGAAQTEFIVIVSMVAVACMGAVGSFVRQVAERYRKNTVALAGNPTGAFKEKVYPKTLYDPAIISDQQILQWGRQAAAEAQAAGRLTREWTGTAPNGLRFHGYLDEAGAVRSFFPDF